MTAPWLCVPSRDTVLVIRLSAPLYGPTQLVGDIDDLVFAVSHRRAIGERQLDGSPGSDGDVGGG